MKLFAWIFGLVGFVFLVGGAWTLVDTRQFVARADTAQGTVIDLLLARDGEGDAMYRPLVLYETAAGAMVEFVGSVGSRPASYDVGEAVTVL